MRLKRYITLKFGGTQSAFALGEGVMAPQVTQWIKAGYIVIDGVLYSPRRKLVTAAALTRAPDDEPCRCGRDHPRREVARSAEHALGLPPR